MSNLGSSFPAFSALTSIAAAPIGQLHQRLFIGALGDRIKAGICVRHTNFFGLRAISGMAQNPAVSLKGGYRGADGLDHANALVAENAPWRTTGLVALEDVQIGAANGCPADPVISGLAWFSKDSFPAPR
jgi:hypothetical protein